MADNVNILDSVGTSVPIATDEVADATLGTVQVQYVKLMDGTNGGTNRAEVDSNGNLQTLAKAIVSDTPESYVAGEMHPLSITAEGRLRVAMAKSDVTQVWQASFESMWDGCENPWRMENNYV